ncbi:suppression of tumorigenicity 5 st5 [Anaeramoeba flamelloides]|uniref:Suppression of tumorigenicity 5 st5 n=1 Tax=Anaeramoeba flamelloides TaxID=1746091 RepID=A0AAV8ACH2_9EUKA|nr:suppression of tumorigenicity 5 st5 [Anaeramoeba flamelloides]
MDQSFERFYLVEYNLGSEQNNSKKKNQIEIKYAYPDLKKDEIQQKIKPFCFADIGSLKEKNLLQNDTISFVITLADGSRQYVVCNRNFISKEKNPTALLFVTKEPYLFLFSQILRFIRGLLGDENIIKEFLNSLVKQRISNRSKKVSVIYGTKQQTFEIVKNWHLSFLLETLDEKTLICLFASILFERRILISCSSLEKLTFSIQALISLIQPFTWQGILVPILPNELIDISLSPIPYILGCHSTTIPHLQELEIEEIVYCDLDQNWIDFDPVDPSLLPSKSLGALVKAIKPLLKKWKTFKNENMIINGINRTNVSILNQLHDCFYQFFNSTFPHIERSFIEDKQSSGKCFNFEIFTTDCLHKKKKFVKFAKQFSETQMFDKFIQIIGRILTHGALVSRDGASYTLERNFLKLQSNSDLADKVHFKVRVTKSETNFQKMKGKNSKKSNPKRIKSHNFEQNNLPFGLGPDIRQQQLIKKNLKKQNSNQSKKQKLKKLVGRGTRKKKKKQKKSQDSKSSKSASSSLSSSTSSSKYAKKTLGMGVVVQQMQEQQQLTKQKRIQSLNELEGELKLIEDILENTSSELPTDNDESDDENDEDWDDELINNTNENSDETTEDDDEEEEEEEEKEQQQQKQQIKIIKQVEKKIPTSSKSKQSNKKLNKRRIMIMQKKKHSNIPISPRGNSRNDDLSNVSFDNDQFTLEIPQDKLIKKNRSYSTGENLKESAQDTIDVLVFLRGIDEMATNNYKKNKNLKFTIGYKRNSTKHTGMNSFLKEKNKN